MNRHTPKNERAGRYITQPNNYRAFIPNPLPPKLELHNDIILLLSEADRALGRLDSATELLPNPDFFIEMFVRQEAVFSSQIEGTQSSLSDLVEYEANIYRGGKLADVRETSNYVSALKYGLERLRELPLSLRLLKEIHLELLKGARGSEKNPGQFRTTQNWIGPDGCTLNNAMFVPPPPQEVLLHMGALETFIQNDLSQPPLIKCALVHSQFETIHPFADGNGRLGRLLITFILCWSGTLKKPLLYLSHYFKKHRDEYYSRLQDVRDNGYWEDWLRFFLDGVRQVAADASETARKIQMLRDAHREILSRERGLSVDALNLLDQLYWSPVISINAAKHHVGKSFPTANKLILRLEKLGLLREITGQRKNKLFVYQPYLDLFGVHIPARKSLQVE